MKKMVFAALMVLAVLAFSGPVMALTINPDCDLSDWGLSQIANANSDWKLQSTWIPTINGIPYLVEDNYNPLQGGNTIKGIHIQGVSGQPPNFYDEPKVQLKNGNWVYEPYGGEPYDLEAYYLTQDQNNIYVAIITSVASNGNPPPGQDRWPGDLALKFGTATYPTAEYNTPWGVKLGTVGAHAQGDIVKLPDWQGTGYTNPVRPDIMLAGYLPGGQEYPGAAQVCYQNLNKDDNGYPNYVIEVSIPKATVGMAGMNAGMSQISLTDNCLNEDLYVPEFPTMAVTLGIILGVTFIVFGIKQKKE